VEVERDQEFIKFIENLGQLWKEGKLFSVAQTDFAF